MNKLLVVTGGSKGIGKALAWKFASQGFDVATCARTPEPLHRLQADFAAAFPHQHLWWQPADLSRREDVAAFATFVQQLGRPVEVLVNNAGYFVPGQVHAEPDGILEAQIEANLYSAYRLTRALLPDMVARRHGHLFTMCSIASIMAYPNGGSYSISKFALYGMTKVLREELKQHNIRVTAVLPGATLTDSWEGTPLPADRFMRPEDVAAAVHAAYALSGQTVLEELILRPQLGDL